MKIAIISDIHGNYHALAPVIEDIKKESVDSIVCLGDVITIGPNPKEVLEKLKAIDCYYIIGNHDQALLYPEKAFELQIAPPLISSLEWCLQKLNKNDLDFLRTFKQTHKLFFNQEESFLGYHGSPQSNIKNILVTTPKNELEQIFGKHKSTIFAGGHTHIQMLRQYNGKWIINPGSIGMPFHHTPAPGEEPSLLPFAEYAIIHLNTGQTNVELRRTLFDIRDYKQELIKSTLPIKDWLIKQYI